MDNRTPLQRHFNMSHIRSDSTKPEISLRHALWRRGFRYRVNDKKLPGKPDLVLPKYHTIIFVHGCFWHGHDGCKNYSVPKTHTGFWQEKVARNKERDQDVWRQLEAKGWGVIIVWECELKKAWFQNTLSRVDSEIRNNLEVYLASKENRIKARHIYLEARRQQKEKEQAIKEELNHIFSH